MKNSKKIIIILIALIMMIPAIATSQGGPAAGMFGGPTEERALMKFIVRTKWWDFPEVQERLKLTEAQVDELEEIYVEYNREIIELESKVKSARFELEYLLQKDEYDMNEIEDAIDTMLDSVKALEKLELMTRVKMLDILEPEQREMLMGLVRKVLEERFRKGQKGGKGGPQGDKPRWE